MSTLNADSSLLRSVILTFLLACTSQVNGQSLSESETNPDSPESDIRLMEGLPEHLIYLYTEPANEDPLAPRQVIAEYRKWDAGRVLKVCFFSGNPTVALLVRNVASEWNDYSSTKFDFGPPDTFYNCLSTKQGFFQIRIGFSGKGYWSVPGKDAEDVVLPQQPSMNLQRFSSIYSNFKTDKSKVMAEATPYHKAVIRHEFGHALGLLHEQQNPELHCYEQIKWKGKGNVYEYYRKSPNFWTDSDVNINLGPIGDTFSDHVEAGTDLDSIMMYSLPPEIFKDPSSKCITKINYLISDKDKEVVAKLYPHVVIVASKIDPPTLKPNGSAITTFPAATAFKRPELLEMIMVDIESVDAYRRRDARIRLQNLIDKGLTKTEFTDLLIGINKKPYRYQLGVFAALGNTSIKLDIDEETEKEISIASGQAKDKTLIKNILAAQKNIRMETDRN